MKSMSIVPVHHLDLTTHDTHFMALMHLVQTSEAYRQFFKARANAGKFVLLDDSAIEMPGLATADLVMESAFQVHASEVMLIDVIRDKNATLTAAYDMLQGILSRFSYPRPFRVMAVPQGSNWIEWLECAKEMASWPEVDTLGISYTVTDYFGTRAWALDGLRLIGALEKTIHLLGCFDVKEVKATAHRYPHIRSIDSAIATIFTQQGMKLGDGAERSHDLSARIIDFSKLQLPVALLWSNLWFWRQQVLETESYVEEGQNDFEADRGTLRHLST